MTSPTVLLGSDAIFAANASRVGDLHRGSTVDVTVRLRMGRRPPAPGPAIAAPAVIHPTQHAMLNSASDADISKVISFAKKTGLNVIRADPAQRTMVLRGDAAAFAKAFAVRLGLFKHDDLTCRSYRGPITLNPMLAGVVQAVIGLEDSRAVRTFFQRGAAATPLTALTPATLAATYNFPPQPDGHAPSIAVIGFAQEVPKKEVEAYARAAHSPVPSIEAVKVCDMGQRDAASDDDRDGLSMMLQVLSVLVPKAQFTVYLTAPTERGCVEALLAAIHAAPPHDIICLGWGIAEERLTHPTIEAIDSILHDAATLGITICAAAGDSGSAIERGSDLAGVQYPAASPYALACGGTALGPGLARWSECVWNEGPQGAAGGGGVSALAAIPHWQVASQPPLSVRTHRHGLGVPDVAAHAARKPGVACLVGGRMTACGGTALSTALWAALLARIRQTMVGHGHDARLGLIAPTLYRLAPLGLFNSPPMGTNEPTGRVGGYPARFTWDPCTGLGTPNGKALLAALLADREPAPGAGSAAEVRIDWTPKPGLVREIVEGRDGSLWALGTVPAGGQWPLFRATPFGWSHVAGAYGCALAVGLDGNAWVASDTGVVRFFDGRTWHVHPGRAASLAVAADGALWIVDHDKDGGNGVVRRWTDGAFADSGIVASRIKVDSIGVPLAIAADGSGFRLSHMTWRHIAENITELAIDRTGVTWAVTRGAGRIWRLDAANATWHAARASAATRLFGQRNGGLLAIQPGGALYSGHAHPLPSGATHVARSA
jgi:kumamolisin